MQPVWDAERAQEKAKANREELIRLAKETGVKVRKIDLGFLVQRISNWMAARQ